MPVRASTARYFSTERLQHGGFSARFYERLGLKDGEPIPETLRAHVAAGVQRAMEDAAIRMAGKGTNLCLAGGLGLNALLVSALENALGFRECVCAAGLGQCRNGDRRGARSLARRYRAEQRVPLRHAVLWARLTPPPKSNRCWRTASCVSATW